MRVEQFQVPDKYEAFIEKRATERLSVREEARMFDVLSSIAGEEFPLDPAFAAQFDWELSSEEELNIGRALAVQEKLLREYCSGKEVEEIYREFMVRPSIRGENNNIGVSFEENLCEDETGCYVFPFYSGGEYAGQATLVNQEGKLFINSVSNFFFLGF